MSKKKRLEREYEYEEDDDCDDDDGDDEDDAMPTLPPMPSWSFNRVQQQQQPMPPSQYVLREDAQSEGEAMGRVWDSLIRQEGSSVPLPVLPARTVVTYTGHTAASAGAGAAAAGAGPNRKLMQLPPMLSGMSPDIIDSLSTYDKPERSAAPAETRHTNFFNRVLRADDKVQEAAASGREPQSVDDSLMRDLVGTYLDEYRQHAEYKTSERKLPSLPSFINGANSQQQQQQQQQRRQGPVASYIRGGGQAPGVDGPLAMADTGYDEEDDDGGDYDDGYDADIGEPDVHTRLAIDLGPDADDALDDAASRVLVAPMRRIPNTADTQTIKTFSEYTGSNPAAAQFSDNIRHVKGRERGVYMEIRDNTEIYPAVTERMQRQLLNIAIQRVAVQRGLVVSDPPLVTKAEIQDGLHAPNPLVGERPCVKGAKCASWKMCLRLIKNEPELYKGAKPFVCKEFYFGDRGREIKAALLENRPLAEVQAPELLLCVMCHLRVVTKWYKQFAAGLIMEPPHILHSFQVSVGAPGGYPIEKCLMGDKKFLGVTAPYLRHVPDNYAWVSSSGVTERDQVTGRMVVREGPAIQCWRERICMDFQ